MRKESDRLSKESSRRNDSPKKRGTRTEAERLSKESSRRTESPEKDT